MNKTQKVSLLLLCIACATLCEFFYARQLHNLSHRQEWYSQKIRANFQSEALVGFTGFIRSRRTLIDDRLNMGTWFGYNDVIYKKRFKQVADVKIKFGLDEDSYLITDLYCTPTYCQSLRLSRAEAYPPALLKIESSGRFIQKVPLSKYIGSGNHTLQLTYQNNNTQIYLDGTLLQTVTVDTSVIDFPLHFRSGAQNSFIYSVQTTNADGETLNLDFSPQLSWLRFSIFLILFLSLIFVFILIKKKNLFFSLVLIFSTVLAVVGILYIFDLTYWSRLYFADGAMPINANNLASTPAEQIEEHWRKLFITRRVFHEQNSFMSSSPVYKESKKSQKFDYTKIQFISHDGKTLLIKDNMAELDSIFPHSFKRVAFLGGSQIYGAGASQDKFAIASLLIKHLNLNSRNHVAGINFSQAGANLNELLQRIPDIINFHPSLLIVDIGFNDGGTDPAQFKSELKNMADKLKSARIPTLYIEEGVSYESFPDGLTKSPEIRQVSQAENLETASLWTYLQSPEVRDSGLIWHDLVHLTDYGHQLAADYILNTKALHKFSGK